MFQNFTVTVPSFPAGPAKLNLAYFTLVGVRERSNVVENGSCLLFFLLQAGPNPELELTDVPINIL